MHRPIARPASLVAIVALLAAACAGPAASAAPASAALDPAKDKLAQVLARGTLVLFTDPDYAPQSFAVKGATRQATTKCESNQLTAPEISGYDAETGKLVAAALGVEPCSSAAVQRGDRGRLGRPLGRGLGLGGDHGLADEGPVRHPALLLDAGQLLRRADSPIKDASELAGKQIGAAAAVPTSCSSRASSSCPARP